MTKKREMAIDYATLSEDYGRMSLQAERIVLTLRNKLREADPSLPEIWDGPKWAELEEAWDVDYP